jgi:hypothetical protein
MIFTATTQAERTMDAEQRATVGTCPFDGIGLDKVCNAILFDGQQIFDHTHSIFGTIALVQLLQSFAREF